MQEKTKKINSLKPDSLSNQEYIELYSNYLEKFVSVEKPVKVVFDFFGGATGTVAGDFLKKQEKIESCFLNQNPDSEFKANGPNPLEDKALEQLSLEIKKQNADMGVAFDADGDRAFLLDEKGVVLPAFATASLLFEESEPPFVVDELVFKSLEYTGFSSDKIHPSKIGTYFIKSKMRETEANIGAEFSGHYYFKNFFYSDSGLLTAILAINALSKFNGPLSGYISKFPPHAVVNQNIKMDEDMIEKIEEKLEIFAQKNGAQIQKREGITLDLKKEGWINVRKSNTEPLVRFVAGTKNKQDALEIIETVKNILT